MADWQEAVQSIMIGFVFAYMVTKLFSLMSSFREDKLRVVSYNEDVAPADGQNVPRSIPEEELEADGDDEQVSPETTAPSSSSSASEPEGNDHHTLEMIPHPYDEIHVATDGGALSEVSIPENDDDKEEVVNSPVVCDDTKTNDVATEDLNDKVASLGEEGAVIALSEGAGEDVTKESEEGNVTDDWEGVESTELEELFGAASTYVTSLVTLPGVKPSSDAMLQLYAYYKIATEGPCSTIQPSAFQPTARAKWTAWQKLGSMPQEEAMEQYVAVLTEIDPTWQRNQRKKRALAEEAVEQFAGNLSQPSDSLDSVPVFSSMDTREEAGEETCTVESIHTFAMEGNLAGLGQLLDSGTAVDLKDSDGRTPLSWAADCGHLNAVEILVAKGAELNSKVCGVVAWTLSNSLCIPNQLRNLVVWFKSAAPLPTFLGSVARWTQTKRCRDN
jgi:acyl-CoA-binding protein